MILQCLVLIVGIMASVELMLRLPFRLKFTRLRDVLRQAFRVLRSSVISDCWKEKVAVVYAGRLLVASMEFSGLCLLGLVPVVLCILCIAKWFGEMFDFVVSPMGGLVMVMASSLYFFVRAR